MGLDTAGGACSSGPGLCFVPGNEEGTVVYKVGGGEAALDFNNPASGKNTCDVRILSAGLGDLTGDCEPRQDYTSTMTYVFHSLIK